MSVKETVARLVAKTGYEVRRPTMERDSSIPRSTAETVRAVAPYTMTSPERVVAACDAVRYAVRYGIPGAIVECGVWAGGSSMAMARTLNDLGVHDREMYLFDTFEGMSEPTSADADRFGVQAADTMASMDEAWCYTSIEDVQANMRRTSYPMDNVHFVKGKVEDTIPARGPEKIAVLRLDTDWYESTAHELEHLVPRISDGGVLLIDDYGHWEGARRAVDEWVDTCGFPVLLARSDYTGRLAVIRR